MFLFSGLKLFSLEVIYSGASMSADLGPARLGAARNASNILTLLAPRTPDLGSAS
jgi:hypothetical protein